MNNYMDHYMLHQLDQWITDERDYNDWLRDECSDYEDEDFGEDDDYDFEEEDEDDK
jgi:hypothetical protein